MNFKQVIESAAIIAGAALAIGFIKRTKLAETIATRVGIPERQASLAGSLARVGASLATAAFIPASAPYSIPLFYAAVSETAASSIKPPV